MKIELVRDETGKYPTKTIGWDIVGETEEEKRILGTMRDFYFWGLHETVIKYDGMTSDPEDEDYVQKLHFRIEAVNKAEREERLNRD